MRIFNGKKKLPIDKRMAIARKYEKVLIARYCVDIMNYAVLISISDKSKVNIIIHYCTLDKYLSVTIEQKTEADSSADNQQVFRWPLDCRLIRTMAYRLKILSELPELTSVNSLLELLKLNGIAERKLLKSPEFHAIPFLDLQRGKGVMEFVNVLREAYCSGFVDNNPTVYDIYRSAQHHVKDNYGIDTEVWDDEFARLSRGINRKR